MEPGFSPALVGRSAEIERLTSALNFARSGHGQIAIISGEAGIGKTRLTAATKALALQLGFDICQGNCFKPDRTIPYAPLLDLLHTFLLSRREDEIVRLLHPWASLLAQLLPEVTGVMPSVTPARLAIPEQEKNHFFYAIEQFLVHLAADSPLLVVIEDIHWSDDTSLDFLLGFARRIDTQPILLVLTYRDEDDRAALTNFLIGLDRGGSVQQIPLSPLTRDEVETMLRAIFAVKQPITPEFLDAIDRLTEGNPFFIEEVIKSLLVQGDIYLQRTGWDRRPMSQLRIPRTLQIAVEQQVASLSPDTKLILTLAAVVGRRFDFVLLQALSGMDEEALLARVKELLATQLVVEETADQYAFRHALTCEAIYSALLARERRVYHRQIAQALERLYGDAVEPYLADLAYHYFEAAAWQQAYEYSQRAGERAQRLDAIREASEWFTRAIAAGLNVGVQPPSELYRARGQAYETIGELDAARADYQQALQLASAVGDAQTEWQALLDLGFSWAATNYETMGEYLRRALGLARTLDNPRLIGQSLNRMGNWHMMSEQALESKQYHLDALALYELIDDRRGLAETLDLLGICTALRGQVIESHAYYMRAVGLMRELNDRRGLSSSLAMLSALSANCFMDTSASAALPLPDSLSLATMALDLAREVEWRSGEVCGLIVCGLSRGAMGHYGQALDDLSQALSIAREIDHRQWTIFGLVVLGCLYRDLFALASARECLEQAYALAKDIDSPYWFRLSASFLASAYVHDNALEAASVVLASALHSDTKWTTRAEITVWAARAELMLAEGEPEACLKILEPLMEAVMPVSRAAEAWCGAPRLQMWYGQALAAYGQYDSAETQLKYALQTAQAQAGAPLEWRIHRALSRLYRSQRRFEAAENAVVAAQTIIEGLADNLPDDDLRQAFLSHATIDLAYRPLSARRAAKRASGGLTERERQVAALVAQGLSSPEIAAALVLSERTVEKHIGNILNKLGFNRRAQIVTWVAEKGLLKAQDHHLS